MFLPSRDFIGQTVLHRLKANGGEILRPVIIIGLLWAGLDWEYEVLLPQDHPEWVEEDNEFRFLPYHRIEPIEVAY